MRAWSPEHAAQITDNCEHRIKERLTHLVGSLVEWSTQEGENQSVQTLLQSVNRRGSSKCPKRLELALIGVEIRPQP